jgi:hypothetical protein
MFDKRIKHDHDNGGLKPLGETSGSSAVEPSSHGDLHHKLCPLINVAWAFRMLGHLPDQTFFAIEDLQNFTVCFAALPDVRSWG